MALPASQFDTELQLKNLLNGKQIVVITAGCPEKRFIFERANELGACLVLVDSADSWAKALPFVQFLPVELDQNQPLAVQCTACVEKLQEMDRLDGVCTFADLSVELTARVARALNLPGHTVEAAETARNKARTRTVLQAKGVNMPTFQKVKSKEDLAAAAGSVGFPAVLKPACGAASVAVKKVKNMEELEAAYQEALDVLASYAVVNGNIMKDSGHAKMSRTQSVVAGGFLLETYLDGDEVDVDVILSSGTCRFAAVSDNGPTLGDYFNETWAVSPSLLSEGQQEELRQKALQCLEALGFQSGVFHVELKYTSHGPQLIEINARMGGGPVYLTNLLAWGVDLIAETLIGALGQPSTAPVPQQARQCIVNADVNALSSGKLLDLEFLKPLNHPAVVKHTCHVAQGDEVTGPDDGLPTWLVEVVISGPSPQQCLDFYMDLEKQVQQKVHIAPLYS